MSMASPFLTQQPLSPFFPHGIAIGQLPAGRDLAGGDLGDRGKWTGEEHTSFLRALEEIVASTSDGNDWDAIAKAVGRPEEDVKRHAQHYFLKLEHERSVPAENILQVLVLRALAHPLLPDEQHHCSWFAQRAVCHWQRCDRVCRVQTFHASESCFCCVHSLSI